jgi:hypothetical protein
METLNIHSFIDGVPNYIFIIQLEKRNKFNKPYIVAMHSERPLKKNDSPNTDKGFIASVTNKKSFFLIKNEHNP